MAYPKKAPHGIMFHHFHGGKHLKTQGSISADDFKSILDYVGHDRILTPAKWLEKLSKKTLAPKDICLTFDDSLLSQFDIALPILEHFNLKAFWFIYSGVFEGRVENLEVYRFFWTKYFSRIDDFYELFFQRFSESDYYQNIDPKEEEQSIKASRLSLPLYSFNDARFRFIRDKVLSTSDYGLLMDSLLKEYGADKSELAKNLWMSDRNLKYLSDSGHSVGLHSYSHPTVLSALSLKEQRAEYQKNYSHIYKICGQRSVAMSHPCNSYTEDILQILKELGIVCGFRVNMLVPENRKMLNATNLEIAREDPANIMAAIRS